MNRPSILVVDDGELGIVSDLLTELETPFEHLESPDVDGPLMEPEQLLVTTARRAVEHQYRRGVSALSPRAVGSEERVLSERRRRQTRGREQQESEPSLHLNTL